MKNKYALLALIFAGVTLTACSSDYVIQKKNEEMIITKGKPVIDEDTGLVTYTDTGGNEHEINRNQIIQIIEK